MKKFIRNTAVLGAVLTVLGFGTASAAHVQGGRWGKMQLWEGSIPYPRNHFVYSVPVGADRGKKLDENSRSFPCLSELSLEIDFANVTVQPSESDRIIVRCGSSEDFQQMVWGYAEDDEVKVAVYGKKSGNRKPEVTVFVPENFSFQEMDIELGGGSCSVGGVNVRELCGETAGGSLLIKEAEAAQVYFSCTAGKISYYGRVLEDLDIDCAAGNIACSGEILGDVEADCAAGNIYLELIGQQESDFNYEVDGTGGNIQVGDKSYSGMLFEKEIYHGAPRKMELQSAAGNIQIEFTSPEVSGSAQEAEKMQEMEADVQSSNSVGEAEKAQAVEVDVQSSDSVGEAEKAQAVEVDVQSSDSVGEAEKTQAVDRNKNIQK